MPKPKEQFEEMRVVTVNKLKKSGLELFARKGLAATNIKEIAKNANVSLGLIYHYYKSKDELYLSLANEAMEKSRNAFEPIMQLDASFKEKITLFKYSYMRLIKRMVSIISLSSHSSVKRIIKRKIRN